MVEDITVAVGKKRNKNYIEIVIRQYKPILFGILSCVCLVLAALEIVAGIFFIFSLTFLLLTIVTIVTGQQRNTRKIRLE